MYTVLEHKLDEMIRDISRGDERLAFLLETCWKRVVLKQYGKGDLQTGIVQATRLMATHVRDWLAAAMARDAKWLANLDNAGRPKKLLKFGSVDALLREVNRDMERFARNQRKIELDPAEETIEMELADGWLLVRMLTPRALDQESGRMGHCIGGGGYDAELLSGTSRFLSLRDPYGKPHVTISVADGEIREVSGKANARPPFRYMERLTQFFVAHSEGDFFDGTNGVVLDIHGKLHPVDHLPAHLEVQRDLDLFWSEGAFGTEQAFSIASGGSVAIEFDATVSSEGQRHPFRIDAISGASVYLIGLKLERFPDIECSGNLILDHSEFPEMSSGMTVNGNLTMKGVAIDKLPDTLRVEGHLDVSGISVESMPADLRARAITMTSSAITNLPDQTDYLFVDASKSKLGCLPAGLRIAKGLDISGSDVKSIPEDVSVFSLIARNCRLRLPERLRDVVEADFMGSTILLTGDLECPDRVRFRTTTINLSGKRLVGKELIDLSGAHFDGLPSVIRADIVDLRRLWSSPMPLLDIDIETRILALTDYDLIIGPNVKVTEFIDIGTEWDRIRFAPDAARDYLSKRHEFVNRKAAKIYYGGIDVEYHPSHTNSRYPHWKLDT